MTAHLTPKIRRIIERHIENGNYGNDARTARVLLASAVLGPNADLIARELGYSRKFVREKAARLRKHRVWVGARVASSEWFKKGGGIAFVLDVCVADGLMGKTGKKP